MPSIRSGESKSAGVRSGGSGCGPCCFIPGPGHGKSWFPPGKLLLNRPFCRKKGLMQISKSVLVVCATAYCAALLPLCAADADINAKLREAMEKKLDELKTQPPTNALKPAVAAPAPATAPAAQPPPAPAVIAPPPPGGRPTPPAQWTPPPTARSTAKPVLVAPPPVDSDAIAKAREAMRQKLAEMETQTAPAPTIPAQPVPAVQPMPAAVAPAP